MNDSLSSRVVRFDSKEAKFWYLLLSKKCTQCLGLNHMCVWLALPLPCLLQCPHMSEELFPVGKHYNKTRSLRPLSVRSLKPLSSFGVWKNSINQLRNNESDVILCICNFEMVLSHWFPMRKSSSRMCRQEDRTMKEASEGQGLAEHKRDLARGEHNWEDLCFQTRNQ